MKSTMQYKIPLFQNTELAINKVLLKRSLPMDESSLSVHQIKLVV